MEIAKNRIIEPSVHFRLLTTGERKETIWQELEAGAWKHIQPELFESNTQLGELNRASRSPIMNDILPIHRGMVWEEQNKRVTDPRFLPQLQPTILDDFLQAAKNFFDRFQDKHIGIHLSGGLDSSIIIALLKYFEIPFSLVGMTTTRYEFRTERYLQQILAEWGRAAVLLDYDNYLPLSYIEDVPPHQYPEMLSGDYYKSVAMAKECEQLGINLLLTGNGGDNLFAEPIPNNPDECTWMPQVFGDPWLEDFAYSPEGVEVQTFYADEGVMNAIYNLRLGQVEDNAKLWARQFFKDFLPKELVNYTYCADFWGLHIDGLLQALPTIQKLFNNAYDLTGNIYFSPKKTKELLNQDLLEAEKKKYQAIESRIALAIWLNSLFKSE